ncbi:hypothetical protein LY76DRAFT_344359 [Colletotrichum caudatum]|nr:hypothetical protein LY76DRAFT_344359 [Colletotrichum caudatum]
MSPPPPLPRAPRIANKTHPEYLAHRVWASLMLPPGIDEQAERARLQDLHNTFLDAFENGLLKLPGLISSSSANNLDSEAANDLFSLQSCVVRHQKKRTPIEFVAASQAKASAHGTSATIHLLTMQSDMADLTWLYREAYLTLQSGGWLMQLQAVMPTPASSASASHTQPSTDPVKTALQNQGFTNLSLSVARRVSVPGSVGAQVPKTAGFYEMRVWTAQKPRTYGNQQGGELPSSWGRY